MLAQVHELSQQMSKGGEENPRYNQESASDKIDEKQQFYKNQTTAGEDWLRNDANLSSEELACNNFNGFRTAM